MKVNVLRLGFESTSIDVACLCFIRAWRLSQLKAAKEKVSAPSAVDINALFGMQRLGLAFSGQISSVISLICVYNRINLTNACEWVEEGEKFELRIDSDGWQLPGNSTCCLVQYHNYWGWYSWSLANSVKVTAYVSLFLCFVNVRVCVIEILLFDESLLGGGLN